MRLMGAFDDRIRQGKKVVRWTFNIRARGHRSYPGKGEDKHETYAVSGKRLTE